MGTYVRYNGKAIVSVQESGPDKVMVLNVAVAAVTVAVLVSYLAVCSNAVQRDSALREAERRLVGLEELEERLGIEVLEKRSMGTLESQISALGYVPVDQVEFLQEGGAVAVR